MKTQQQLLLEHQHDTKMYFQVIYYLSIRKVRSRTRTEAKLNNGTRPRPGAIPYSIPTLSRGHEQTMCGCMHGCMRISKSSNSSTDMSTIDRGGRWYKDQTVACIYASIINQFMKSQSSRRTTRRTRSKSLIQSKRLKYETEQSLYVLQIANARCLIHRKRSMSQAEQPPDV